MNTHRPAESMRQGVVPPRSPGPERPPRIRAENAGGALAQMFLGQGAQQRAGQPVVKGTVALVSALRSKRVSSDGK